jgi:hypothetical protein
VYDGLLDLGKTGVCGEDVECGIGGLVPRDLRGWCAWEGKVLSRRKCGKGLLKLAAVETEGVE